MINSRDRTYGYISVFVSDGLAWLRVQKLFCASWRHQNTTMLGRPRRKQKIGLLVTYLKLWSWIMLSFVDRLSLQSCSIRTLTIGDLKSFSFLQDLMSKDLSFDRTVACFTSISNSFLVKNSVKSSGISFSQSTLTTEDKNDNTSSTSRLANIKGLKGKPSAFPIEMVKHLLKNSVTFCYRNSWRTLKQWGLH